VLDKAEFSAFKSMLLLLSYRIVSGSTGFMRGQVTVLKGQWTEFCNGLVLTLVPAPLGTRGHVTLHFWKVNGHEGSVGTAGGWGSTQAFLRYFQKQLYS